MYQQKYFHSGWQAVVDRVCRLGGSTDTSTMHANRVHIAVSRKIPKNSVKKNDTNKHKITAILLMHSH